MPLPEIVYNQYYTAPFADMVIDGFAKHFELTFSASRKAELIAILDNTANGQHKWRSQPYKRNDLMWLYGTDPTNRATYLKEIQLKLHQLVVEIFNYDSLLPSVDARAVDVADALIERLDVSLKDAQKQAVVASLERGGWNPKDREKVYDNIRTTLHILLSGDFALR